MRILFPDPMFADAEGLVAVGGDLSVESLLTAYKKGIFPWYNVDQPICWWSPDPRFVLFPNELRVSKSMKTILQNGVFRFTINKAFEQVITNCREILRNNEPGSWLNNSMISAYTEMHNRGFAHSAEAWKDGELVGGLYGIKLGNVFFGESMFSKVSNGSKFAFIHYVSFLKTQNVQLIDCQVYSKHLETMGAIMIPREMFLKYIVQ